MLFYYREIIVNYTAYCDWQIDEGVEYLNELFSNYNPENSTRSHLLQHFLQ